MLAAPSFFAQDPFVTGFDTEYPANYTGVGAEPVPTSASDGWHFPRPLFTAPETYPQRFSGLSCGPLPKGFTVSYRMLHTPEGTEDYAVHLTLLNPYPNNITGILHRLSCVCVRLRARTVLLQLYSIALLT